MNARGDNSRAAIGRRAARRYGWKAGVEHDLFTEPYLLQPAVTVVFAALLFVIFAPRAVGGRR